MNPFADIPQSPPSPDENEGKEGFGLIVERYYSRDAKRVVVPDGVTQILPGAFRGHSEIIEVVLPETLESVGREAFRDCTALAAISIPDAVFEIGQRAFSGCSELACVHLPAGLMRVERSVFSRCAKLREVHGGGEVFLVGDGAFSGCGALQRMPDFPCLEAIGSEAFSGCSSLEHALLPSAVRAVGTEAFRNCAKLREAALPHEVQSMGKNVFAGCFLLDRVDGADELAARFPDAFPRALVNGAGMLRPQDRVRDERDFARAHADEIAALLEAIEGNQRELAALAREREALGPLDRAAKRKLDARVASLRESVVADQKRLDALRHPSADDLLAELQSAQDASRA